MALDGFVLQQLTQSQVPALLAGGLGLLLSARHRTGEHNPRLSISGVARSTLGLVLIACCGLWAYRVINAPVRWPIASALQATFWILTGSLASALLLGAAGASLRGLGRSDGMRTAVALLLVLIVCAGALALPVLSVQGRWTHEEAWQRVGGAGLGVCSLLAGLALLLRRVGEHPQHRSVPAWGYVLLLSLLLGASAQLLALDFDSLRLSIVTGSLATALLAGGIALWIRAKAAAPSSLWLACLTALVVPVLLTALWQAANFGGAEWKDAAIYAGCVATAPWLALLASVLTSRVLRVQRAKFAWWAAALLGLAPVLGASLSLVPALGLSLQRSGVLSESDDEYDYQP